MPDFHAEFVGHDECSRGENVLPSQLGNGLGIFAVQGVWELYVSAAPFDVAPVQVEYNLKVCLEIRSERLSNHGDAIVVAFSTSHG